MVMGFNKKKFFGDAGYHLPGVLQVRATSPGPGWTSSTSGEDCNDNDPARNVDCNPVRGWFLDNDNDGYFATVKMSFTKPITPAGNWTDVITKGPDCDDTNPAIAICSAMPSLLTYYIDNDGDGYDSGTITSTTNMEAPYKTFTKGKDCNDDLFSADNSVCVTPCATNCLHY